MADLKTILVMICRLISGIPLKGRPVEALDPAAEDTLFEHLQYHQIVGLVYHYRDALAAGGLPFSPQLLQKIKNETLMNISRLMFYEHYLKHLDALLKAQRIDYLIFKGVVTAQTVYPRDYLRTFGDLDLLIRPEDLRALETILAEEGFEHADDLYRVFPDPIIRKYSFAQHFNRSDPGNVALDIHLNLSGRLHPFQFDAADFWNSSIPFTLDGRQYRTFDPEHQALYALYHSFKHYFFKLIWFMDTFLLMDRRDLDRAKFQALVKCYKLSRIRDHYAHIARDLFGRLPAAIDDRTGASPSRHRLLNRDTVLNGFLPQSPSRLRLLLPMYYLEGLPARLAFLWRQLFPPRETIRDFYVGAQDRKGVGSYLKLRCKVIAELCLNRRSEDYSN